MSTHVLTDSTRPALLKAAAPAVIRCATPRCPFLGRWVAGYCPACLPRNELVTAVPVSHGLRALLYRRAAPKPTRRRTPPPPPEDPWAGDPPPWEQVQLSDPLTPEAEAALARLTPSQREALGL